jgi:hypothetical protein
MIPRIPRLFIPQIHVPFNIIGVNHSREKMTKHSESRHPNDIEISVETRELNHGPDCYGDNLHHRNSPEQVNDHRNKDGTEALDKTNKDWESHHWVPNEEAKEAPDKRPMEADPIDQHSPKAIDVTKPHRQ